MNFQRLLGLIFILCNTFALLAQAPGGGRGGRGDGPPPKATLTGKIIDSETGEPLEFATITLFSRRDSSIVSGGISDENGRFKIETRPRRCFAKVEFIGYQAKIIERLPINREQLEGDLGEIQMGVDATTLSGVEVRAERSEMQLSLDKKVFNVGKDLANQGGTAEEILDNVPSVAVDIEGNVSLRGSSGVRILVNGKPSSLISSDNAGGLRSLPANMIDQIEVITNPSARYEAEGMAGIINIVLRKERDKGLNGSFDVTAGVPTNYGLGVNLNYRKNKLNWFTNVSGRYRKNPGTGHLYQEIYEADQTLISDQSRDALRGGPRLNARFGADYFFTPKDILTTSLSYRLSDENNLTTYEYLDYLNSIDNLVSVTLREDDELEEELELEGVLTYRKDFERKGHELVVDMRYSDNVEDESSDFVEQYFSPLYVSTRPDSLQRSANKEGETRLQFQVDYVQPFAEDGKWELGYRGSFRTIKNDYQVEEFGDGIWQTITDYTNEFQYDEDIHAIYSIFGNKTASGFSYQAGLRYEYSDVRTEQFKTNEVNPRSYGNFFPSASVGYELAGQNTVQLSYSRRIRRPRFWDLNPFFTFSDARRDFSGNPDLDPEFSHSLELGHIKYWEKGSLSSAIYYRHATDIISRITLENADGSLFLNEGGKFVTRPENLDTRDSYGLEFAFSYNPAKWWRLSGDLNGSRSVTTSGITAADGSSQERDVTAYSWRGRMTSRTTIAKDVDVQLRFNYRSPRNTLQGRRLAIYSLDLGMSKDILKKKGTLTLSARDLLNSRRRRGITQTENSFQESDFQWRSRQVTLTFSYRLNQQNKKRGRGNRGGSGFDGGQEGGEF